MSDAQAPDNNAFSRAFLPGLILGLVVGGLCGAILPDIVAGTQRPDFKSTGHTDDGSHGERDERPRDERSIVDDADGDGLPDDIDPDSDDAVDSPADDPDAADAATP